MKVKELQHHRNGISGLPFFVGIVKDDEDRDMLVVRFPDADKETGAVVCAAFDLALLDKRDIQFGSNSWWGDHYNKVMDTAIAADEEGDNHV